MCRPGAEARRDATRGRSQGASPGSIFEFRADRDTRMVFKLERGTASLLMVGSHDEVGRFIRNR